MKSSPLKRPTKRLRRSPIRRKPPTRQQAMRNSTLAPRSKKTAAMYRNERVPLVRRLLQERPNCEAELYGICTGRSEHCHEILARSLGGSILDEANILCVCAACHDWITDHPAPARMNGFRESRSWKVDMVRINLPGAS